MNVSIVCWGVLEPCWGSARQKGHHRGQLGWWPDISPARSGASNLCGTVMETAPQSACGIQRGSTLKWKRWLLDAINLQWQFGFRWPQCCIREVDLNTALSLSFMCLTKGGEETVSLYIRLVKQQLAVSCNYTPKPVYYLCHLLKSIKSHLVSFKTCHYRLTLL